MLLDRNRVVHSRNVTYDSKSVTNPTPAPTVDRGEDQSVAESDGEEIIDGFAAMDITEHSLGREGAPIIQEGAAADVPVVNPNPGPKMPFTPDQVSEGMLWDSPPELPLQILMTLPDIFRTLPEVQGNATDPWSGDVIETVGGLARVDYAWSTCSPGPHRNRPS